MKGYLEELLHEANEEDLMTTYYQNLRRICWVQRWLCKQGKHNEAWNYGFVEMRKLEGK